MADREEFRDRYQQDPAEVERYKQLRGLYYPLQVFSYLASVPFTLVLLAIGSYTAFDQSNILVSTGRELLLYLAIEGGILLLFIVTYALRKEIRSYEDAGFNVIYHELATCIDKFQDEELESVLVHLDRLRGLIDRYGSAISFRNDEIRRYIAALQELESDDDRKQLLEDTFPDVIDILVDEALVRERSLEPYIEEIRQGRTGPEPGRIVLESIVLGIRSLFRERRNRLALLVGMDILIILIAAIVLAPRPAGVVVAAVLLVTGIVERRLLYAKYRELRALVEDVLEET